MERQEIPIRFAQLRQLAVAVPGYLAERAGATTVPALRAGLEYELGLAGLDTESMILEFSEAYRVDIDAFDFTGLISPEGPDWPDAVFIFPIITYLLIGWLLKMALGLICWPFDNHLAKRIWQQPLPRLWRPTNEQTQPKPLTIGDFVASAAVGRFVRREQVHFQLVP